MSVIIIGLFGDRELKNLSVNDCHSEQDTD